MPPSGSRSGRRRVDSRAGQPAQRSGSAGGCGEPPHGQHRAGVQRDDRAKLIAGLMTGSSAMLAETAHSVADTVNQAFLRVSLNLSAEQPTPDHSFGHGQERFLWTLMAAVGMFLAGAAFAVGYGIYELLHPSESGSYVVAYVVLAVAFVAEGSSWLRARRQTTAEARRADRPLLDYVRRSRDPNVKMVLFEDTAALAGIFIAGSGL